MIKATFNETEWPNVVGYAISATFNPVSAIGSDLWFTVVVRQSAATPLTAVAFDGQKAVAGSLRIGGADRTYTANPVTLKGYSGRMTRGAREAILTFQGSLNPAGQTTTITQTNACRRALAPSPDLNSDYQFALDGDDPEPLLSFGNELAPQGAQLFRFESLRNTKNAWLPRVLAWDQALRTGTPSPDHVQVTLSQVSASPLKIDQGTTARLYVAELYGACVSWPVFPLGALPASARLKPLDAPPSARLKAEARAADAPADRDEHTTVEVAVVEFHAGQYNHLALK